MIHHSKFFAVIPKKIALVVCRFLCLERYNKGEVVYEEGQYGNKMFILSCGAVNLDQNQSTTIESKKRGQGTRRVGDGGRDRRGTRGSRKNKSNSKQRRQGNGKQGKYSINYSSDGTYSRHNDGDEKIKDSHQDGEDTNTLIDQYYSGDCFGEDALLSADSVRESTATASMERTELFVISRKIYDLLQGCV